jgi:hypothetical protein
VTAPQAGPPACEEPALGEGGGDSATSSARRSLSPSCEPASGQVTCGGFVRRILQNSRGLASETPDHPRMAAPFAHRSPWATLRRGR